MLLAVLMLMAILVSVVLVPMCGRIIQLGWDSKG